MDQTPVVYIIDPNRADRNLVQETAAGLRAESRGFSSAEEFLESVDSEKPGCVVTELRLLGMNGLQLQQEMRRRGHRLPVVFLSTSPETRVTVAAIFEGAVTVLEKPARPQELWDAVCQALARDRQNRQQRRQEAELQRRLQTLTWKEQNVLNLILDGVPNKAIARRLDISVRTVETRRAQIFRKTGTRSVAELVRLALEAAPHGATAPRAIGLPVRNAAARRSGDDESGWRVSLSRNGHERAATG